MVRQTQETIKKILVEYIQIENRTNCISGNVVSTRTEFSGRPVYDESLAKPVPNKKK